MNGGAHLVNREPAHLPQEITSHWRQPILDKLLSIQHVISYANIKAGSWIKASLWKIQRILLVEDECWWEEGGIHSCFQSRAVEYRFWISLFCIPGLSIVTQQTETFANIDQELYKRPTAIQANEIVATGERRRRVNNLSFFFSLSSITIYRQFVILCGWLIVGTWATMMCIKWWSQRDRQTIDSLPLQSIIALLGSMLLFWSIPLAFNYLNAIQLLPSDRSYQSPGSLYLIWPPKVEWNGVSWTRITAGNHLHLSPGPSTWHIRILFVPTFH